MDQKELFDRYGQLSAEIKDRRAIIQNELSYINEMAVEEWIANMKNSAKKLNKLYQETLRFLAPKIG